MIVFEEREFDLLWDLFEDPNQYAEGEYVWLIRAAASLEMLPRKDPHREDLVKHYSKHDDHPYHIIGRYLMGLASENEVLSLPKIGAQRCRVAYYIGLFAQGQGRYADASDWYRVAVETGYFRLEEYRWALNTLYTWADEEKTLERIAADVRQ